MSKKKSKELLIAIVIIAVVIVIYTKTPTGGTPGESPGTTLPHTTTTTIFSTTSTYPPTSTTMLPATYCTDSDGGLYIDIPGVIDTGITMAADYCISPTLIREYYCTGTMLKYFDMPCPSGRCVPSGSGPADLCLP